MNSSVVSVISLEFDFCSAFFRSTPRFVRVSPPKSAAGVAVPNALRAASGDHGRLSGDGLGDHGEPGGRAAVSWSFLPDASGYGLPSTG